MGTNEEVFLTNVIGYMNFNAQLNGLRMKIKDAKKNRFKFDKIVKLTPKNDSSLSDENI